MKKTIFCLSLLFTAGLLFAQSDDELFGGGDDDFFSDDGIIEFDEQEVKDDVTTDLSKGILFETGAIKIGGSFSTSLGTSTVLYADDEKDFGEHIKNTTLTPTLSAMLSVDARPTQDLRMYTKFGFAYPFALSATSTAKTEAKDLFGKTSYTTQVTTTVTDWFKLKELFTDFSIADRAFFRFGLHTVTWGTGYFFSPVSDMINTSSIDPENTDAQVDGSVNLRTQITFPGTQNCLWLYIIPSTDFTSAYSAESYIKDTAVAAKGDIVIGNWELGVGGFYKYNTAPKAMLTATGSLNKMSFFGEFVYQYGSFSEWAASDEWKDKSNVFQLTAGLSYFWKTPSIMLAAQYYYDGWDSTVEPVKIDMSGVSYQIADLTHKYFTKGHNAAFIVNFGRVFGTTDVTATVFCMMNWGKEEIPAMFGSSLAAYGAASYLNTATYSAMLNYSPVSSLTIGAGPYMTFSEWGEPPVVSLKLNFTLGGGKF